MSKVTVYTTDPCAFCTRVKALLKSREVEFAEINLSKDPAGRVELARRKAYTARTFSANTSDWAKRTSGDAPLAPQRQLRDVIALAGGVPIKYRNETIGAVGVSGSLTGGDEGCAMAGVTQAADMLK